MRNINSYYCEFKSLPTNISKWNRFLLLFKRNRMSYDWGVSNSYIRYKILKGVMYILETSYEPETTYKDKNKKPISDYDMIKELFKIPDCIDKK